MTFKDKLLAGLNPEQTEVVLHDKGPLQVVAVAGAGKTHALVNRMGYLVGERDVNPTRILAVTFSRDGAREMQERLDAMIGKSGARVGTFHSLGLEIARSEVEDYRSWEIDDSGRYRICLKDATGYREMDWKLADVTVLESFIGLCKANLGRPDSDVSMAIAQSIYQHSPTAARQPRMMIEAYSRAEDIRRERRILTFDDMLMESVELLRDDEGIRSRWASKYDYVLQDEAQDQNLAQLLMGELLAKDHRNYMLVGDPAQTIYTWRGANPDKLLNFEKNWGARVIRMGRNYRCGQTIIDAANLTLDAMNPATKLDIKMLCERTHEDGSRVQGNVMCREYNDLDDEGFSIVDTIKSMMTDGSEPRDIALLYRTNAQSRSPEEALISARIPYRIVGGVSFYERKEVKALLAYLRLAGGVGTLDDISRCINTPFRYLGKAFVEKVGEEAESAGTLRNGDWPTTIRTVAARAGMQYRQRDSAETWARLITEMAGRIKTGAAAQHGSDTAILATPARILEDIIRDTRYVAALEKDEGQETVENSRVSNVREMVRAAGRFTTVSELIEYVDKTLAASKRQAKEKNPNKVTLSSLHKAKGLEWPSVFLIGVSDRILPHGRAEDPEEERRLFYVGVTRARDTLHVSCVRNVAFGAKVVMVEPSPFLAEAGLKPLPLVSNESDEDDGCDDMGDEPPDGSEGED